MVYGALSTAPFAGVPSLLRPRAPAAPGQVTLDADHRCAQAGAATDKARAEVGAAQAAGREEARKRSTTERRAAEMMEALRTVRQVRFITHTKQYIRTKS